MTARRAVGLFCLAVVLLSPLPAAEFHITPDGSPQGTGTRDQPWDLATALAHPTTVQPGDTLWLHEGTYRGGFVSHLTGTRQEPILVRAVAGQRATIDASPRDARDNALFTILGADVVFRDFEVLSSLPQRTTQLAGSWPADIRRGNVDVRGARIALVNLVLHDLASGVGFWAQGESGEISGCLIYNNGWSGPDRGHGHAIYVQNRDGTKRIVDNILFHQFAYGIHAYGSEKAFLKGLHIEGNISFENGCLHRAGDNAPGIMVGGGSPAERIVVRNNLLVAGGIRLGYPWGTTSDDVLCEGNYSEGGLVLRDFRKAVVRKNTVVAHSTVVSLEAAGEPLLAGQVWDENEYFITDGRWGDTSVVQGQKSRGLTAAEWKQQTAFDSRSTFTRGAPSQSRVLVRPNAYQPGRANVAILNPAGAPAVEVDLSAVLKQGQPYRIVAAKDFYGQSIVSSTYDGRPVSFPMHPVTPPPPVGLPEAKLPTTEPRFAAFVVLGETGEDSRP